LSLFGVLANFFGSYMDEVAAKAMESIDKLAEKAVSE